MPAEIDTDLVPRQRPDAAIWDAIKQIIVTTVPIIAVTRLFVPIYGGNAIAGFDEMRLDMIQRAANDPPVIDTRNPARTWKTG